jgi:phosphoribosylformylglycinamidine synthase
MSIRVLILRAPGINRDQDAARACELVGAAPERVHVNRVALGEQRLDDYAMLIIPGGFSYGDHLGAGKLLAIDLAHRLGEQLQRFVADGRPVIGICNGFQVLVKAGVLPGTTDHRRPTTAGGDVPTGMAAADGGSSSVVGHQPLVTLTDNSSGRFECRWVRLAAEPASSCRFTQGIEGSIEVPVAHGEGRIAARDAGALAALQDAGLVALRYLGADAQTAGYPANPNGSLNDIAGLTNAQGNVLGLMPHPENAVLPQQHPRWTREPARSEGDGLVIFRNAVQYAASL